MTPERSNYTAFASFLAEFPDTLALKRFRGLQIRNLLFYQAELAHLQVELEEIEEKDAGEASKRANYRWTPAMAQNALSTEQPQVHDVSSLYGEKMLQIRTTLASYRE